MKLWTRIAIALVTGTASSQLLAGTIGGIPVTIPGGDGNGAITLSEPGTLALLTAGVAVAIAIIRLGRRR